MPLLHPHCALLHPPASPCTPLHPIASHCTYPQPPISPHACLPPILPFPPTPTLPSWRVSIFPSQPKLNLNSLPTPVKPQASLGLQRPAVLRQPVRTCTPSAWVTLAGTLALRGSGSGSSCSMRAMLRPSGAAILGKPLQIPSPYGNSPDLRRCKSLPPLPLPPRPAPFALPALHALPVPHPYAAAPQCRSTPMPQVGRPHVGPPLNADAVEQTPAAEGCPAPSPPGRLDSTDRVAPASAAGRPRRLSPRQPAPAAGCSRAHAWLGGGWQAAQAARAVWWRGRQEEWGGAAA